MTSLRVTSVHLRSSDISCYVTATSFELQPCRKSNEQYTPVFGLLQPLPGDFRSNDVTSGSLPVTWGDVTSFCHVTASSCEVQPCRKWNARYAPVFSLLQPLQVTSGQMTSLPGHFRSSEVTSRLFLSCDCLLPNLQTCRKWNTLYMPVFGLLQPLPGDFRSNDVTSRPLPVTWGHLLSFPVTWRPPPASYCFVRRQTHCICQFSAFYSHFALISGQMTSPPGHFGQLRSRDVIYCHVIASSCELTPCRSPTPSIHQFSAFYSHFEVTSGQMTLLPGHFWSPEDTYRRFLSRNCLLLRNTAS